MHLFTTYRTHVRAITGLLLLVLLTPACSRVKVLDSTEYVAWVDNAENGLKKEKTVGEYRYRAFMKPPQYIAFREAVNSGSGAWDAEAVMKRAEELKGLYHFNFDITSADGNTSVLQHEVSGQEEYAARINYFVSHAQQDFVLVQGVDTLPCSLYHFEQTFGLTPLNTITLGFEKKTQPQEEENKDIQLVFNNRLFNTGEIKFLFPQKKLRSIPQLKL